MLIHLFLFAFSVTVANSPRLCVGFSHKLVQRESCLEGNLVAAVPSSAATERQQGTRSSLVRRHGQACAASARRKYHFTSLLPSVFQLWLRRGQKKHIPVLLEGRLWHFAEL